MKKRILVAGSTGLLGCTLCPFLIKQGHAVIQHSYQRGSDLTCDLTDPSQAASMLRKVKPDVVVNLVGAANVDECERSPQAAYLLNVRAVENIVAGLAGGDRAFLVQVSTDQVYDSFGDSIENDVSLTNVYSLTKYAGELAALRTSAAVLRTNFFGRSLHPHRKSFSDWLLDNFRNAKEFIAFADVSVSPLLMNTLCEAIDRVLCQQVTGVFNVGSNQGMSKADFAEAIAQTFGLSSACMRRGSTADVGLAAYRPKDMRMNSSKFERIFGMELPFLGDEIKRLRGDISVEI